MFSAKVVSQNFHYQQRRPEETILYQAVQANFKTAMARLESDGKILPEFVKKEFDDYLRCGIHAHGFVRCQCDQCKRQLAVAFSCKDRGFCPSCGGRRMAEGAAKLVDGVLPEQRLRQWVLSFPYHLRFLFAFNPKALSIGLEVTTKTILRYYAKKAKVEFKVMAKSGAVALIQRFGGHLNLNIHFHLVFINGAFDKDATFYPLTGPTDADVAEMVTKIKANIGLRLHSFGLLKEDGLNHDSEQLSPFPDLLSEIGVASLENRLFLGADKGRKATARGPGAGNWLEMRGPQQAYIEGFSLHAAVSVDKNDKLGKEHLIRYILRPPLAQDRLKALGNNRFRYEFKRAWIDGTKHIDFSGEELVVRLASLVPPPKRNLIRYYGVIGARSKIRGKIAPKKAELPSTSPQLATQTDAPKPVGKERIAWAKLLKRVFKIDIEKCPCGGTLRVVGLALYKKDIDPILKALGIPTVAPEPYEARPPPKNAQSSFDEFNQEFWG